MDREKLKDQLSNDEFDINQNEGTEAPFSDKFRLRRPCGGTDETVPSISLSNAC